MKIPVRFCSLVVLSPVTGFAHGTEAGGLAIGSLGCAVSAAILLLIVPGKATRKGIVFASVIAAIFVTWVLMFAGVGDWIFYRIRQSLAVWILLGSILPIATGVVVYFRSCRSVSPKPREHA